METKSSPQMKTPSKRSSVTEDLLQTEVASPASAISVQSAKSSGHLIQGQSEQLSSPLGEAAIRWPKLKKVSKEATFEAEKEPLPWLKRPLRRVHKEENMSQQAQEQKTADVELWRSQLRKVSGGEAESSEVHNTHHVDRKRADTCLSCRHDTPSQSHAHADDKKSKSNTATNCAERIDSTKQGVQENQAYAMSQNGLEEVKKSISQRSNSRSSTTTDVESKNVNQVTRTLEAGYSTLERFEAGETRINSSVQQVTRLSRSLDNEIEVFSPLPIMPPNHTCSWKERYLNLTAEVRQLKAEIVSRDRRDTPGLVDVGVNVNQEDDYELGVEGLTIVMHLRGKDDLIINTDLTHASSRL
ncbi:hypothetical protein CORC01_05966 [Colletotrichum orchidophilum]|uniref:Uncharacterized protein n=1 Tax=Colletotrichum orchidophilum TaxID=1209926 RepID=A0A1G4BBB8_9PEZI|nr:uncharacterized protein CORC01_05966 [Colletotrichum orchidophilum]OHE98700.1 hypothetical protein CORC01_05966 [Colletotrichum orchidophilum]